MNLDFWKLLALFVRNSKEETWTQLLQSSVDIRLILKLAGKWNQVWVDRRWNMVNLAMLGRVKGNLIWTIDQRTLRSLCDKYSAALPGNDDIEKHKRWAEIFAQGVLHQITAADVTSSKLTLTPPMYTNRNEAVTWYLGISPEEYERKYGANASATPGQQEEIVGDLPGARQMEVMEFLFGLSGWLISVPSRTHN